jgi:two-component system response regulator PilR (NtrC family)
VALARDGREALKSLRREKFDLIFLDILLPYVGGASVLKAIKRQDPEAIVVIITGYPSHGEILSALDYGPAMLLPKPVKLADIEAVLQIVFKK